MLGIMASMDQKAWFFWFLTMLLALCSLLCLQAQDARLHGRHGPQDSWSLAGAVLGQGFLHTRCCATCGVLVQTVQYWRFRSCSSSRSSALPVDTQRQIPMVLAAQMTISIPQLQLIDNVAVLVVHVVQVPQVQVVFLTCFLISWCRSWRRQSRFFSCRDPHDKSLTCPLLSTTDALWFRTVQKTVEIYGPDHRDFTVAVLLKGGRCPCCVGRACSTVACRGGDSRDPTVQVVEHSSLHGGGGEDEGFRPFYGLFFAHPSTWMSSAGWRGRRELAPRCSATQLGARVRVADSLV